MNESVYNERLNFLNKIELFAEQYSQKHNIIIPNLSGWITDSQFHDAMVPSLIVPWENNNNNLIDYIYTYNIDTSVLMKIKNKLGCKDNNNLLIVPNNTIALVNIVNYIAKKNIKKIAILSPCYFTIPELLSNRNVDFKLLPLTRDNNFFHIPYESILAEEFDAILITNPIFTTGVCYLQEDLNFCKEFLDSGNYIFADESLVAPQMEMVRLFGQYKNFFSIYSPHKYIQFNMLKFSAIVYDADNTDFFEQWNDFYAGGLNLSTTTAIKHFLSSNYNNALNIFNSIIEKRKNTLTEILLSFSNFYTNQKNIGGYCHIYNDKINYSLLNNLYSIKELIKNTNALVLPNSLHGFLPQQGFGFRVNLASFNSQAQNAIEMVLTYLQAISS